MDHAQALHNAIEKFENDHMRVFHESQTISVGFREIKRLCGILTGTQIATISVAPLESPEKTAFRTNQRTICEIFGFTPDAAFEIKDKFLAFRKLVDSLLNVWDKDKITLTKTIVKTARDVINKRGKLVILQGIPGSGKTTTAKLLKMALDILQPETRVDYFEADIYMGNTFDKNRLSECHDSCKNATRSFLQNGGIAIVSNTNTLASEIKPYWLMAQEVIPNFTKDQVLLLEPPTLWRRNANECRTKCTKKNIPHHTFTKYLENLTKNSSEEILKTFTEGSALKN